MEQVLSNVIDTEMFAEYAPDTSYKQQPALATFEDMCQYHEWDNQLKYITCHLHNSMTIGQPESTSDTTTSLAKDTVPTVTKTQIPEKNPTSTQHGLKND